MRRGSIGCVLSPTPPVCGAEFLHTHRCGGSSIERSTGWLGHPRDADGLRAKPKAVGGDLGSAVAAVHRGRRRITRYPQAGSTPLATGRGRGRQWRGRSGYLGGESCAASGNCESTFFAKMVSIISGASAGWV